MAPRFLWSEYGWHEDWSPTPNEPQAAHWGPQGPIFSPLDIRQYLEWEETELTITSRPIGPI